MRIWNSRFWKEDGMACALRNDVIPLEHDFVTMKRVSRYVSAGRVALIWDIVATQFVVHMRLLKSDLCSHVCLH